MLELDRAALPTRHLAVIPYDHSKHGEFVVGTFSDSIEAIPSLYPNLGPHEHTIRRLLRDPSTVTLIATPNGHAAELLGWAMRYDDALVFAYTRYIVRRRGVFRRLFRELGLTTPTPVLYWTRKGAKMAAEGRAFYFDIDGLDRATKLVH